jgi:hypothetical protein
MARPCAGYSGHPPELRPHTGCITLPRHSLCHGRSNHNQVDPVVVTHQGLLAQHTPDSPWSMPATAATGTRIAQPPSSPTPARPTSRRLMAVPVLNGLHHAYAWVTKRGCRWMKRVASTGRDAPQVRQQASFSQMLRNGALRRPLAGPGFCHRRRPLALQSVDSSASTSPASASASRPRR